MPQFTDSITALDAIYGQLGQICRQQKEILDERNKSKSKGKDDGTNVRISISGDVTGFIQSVSKDKDLPKKIDRLATSLKGLEDSIRKIDESVPADGSAFIGLGVMVRSIADASRIIDDTRGLNKRNAKRIVNFASELARLAKDRNIQIAADPDSYRGITALVNMTKTLTEEGFTKRILIASMLLGGKTGGEIGKFWKAVAESVKDAGKAMPDEKVLKRLTDMVDGMADYGYITRMLVASSMLTHDRGMELTALYRGFLDGLKRIKQSDIDRAQAVISQMQSLMDFNKRESAFDRMFTVRAFREKDVDRTVKIIDKLNKGLFGDQGALAGLTPSKMETARKTVDGLLTVVKEIRLIMDEFGPMTLIRFPFAWFGVKAISAVIKVLVDDLLPEIKKAGVTESNIKNVQSMQRLVKELTKLEGLIAVQGLVAPFAIAGGVLLWAASGLAVIAGGHLAQMLLDRKDLFDKETLKAVKQLGLFTLAIGGVLFLLAGTALLLNRIGFVELLEGLAKTAVLFGALVGVMWVLSRPFIQRMAAGANMNMLMFIGFVALTTLAIGALAVTATLAEGVSWKGILKTGALIVALIAIGGVLAAASAVGVLEGALAGAVLLGGAIVALTGSLVLSLWLMQIAGDVRKGMRNLRTAVMGMVDLITDIGVVKSVQLGLAAPGLVLFAATVILLNFAIMMSVLTMNVARLGGPKARRALRDVVRTMIDVFETVDDNFGGGWVGFDLLSALTAGASVAIFAISTIILNFAVMMSVLTMNVARLGGPKARRALKDVIGCMIDVFEMVDDNFMWGVPGLDILSAASAGISVAVFAVSVGILMAATLLSILTMNLAKTVSARDRKAFTDVIGTMIRTLDDIGTFRNVYSSIMSIPVVAALTVLSGVTAAYIGVLALYGAAQKKYGDLGALGSSLAKNLNSFIKDFGGGTSVWEKIGISVKSAWATSLLPMLLTAGKFASIIKDLAGASVLTGYDANGKPTYRKIEQADYRNAAAALNEGFGTFIRMLAENAGNLKEIARIADEDLGEMMIPLMQSTSFFADAIIKLATQQIPQYDENGKQTGFKPVPKETYTTAAGVLAGGFGMFITSLAQAAKEMGDDSEDAIEALSEAMLPLMQSTTYFADAIIKLATQQIPQYDADGRIIGYKPMPKQTYTDAAKVLSDGFDDFMITLQTSADKMSYWSDGEARALGDAMAAIMGSIGSFTDAIISISTGEIVEEYDADGKPRKVRHLTWTDFKGAAEYLVKGDGTGVFEIFMDKLVEGAEKLDSDQQKAMEALSQSIMPVMEGVGSFADTIVKLATATYVDHYDADGKPVMKVITREMYSDAADKLTESFNTFLTQLTTNLSGSTALKAQLLLKALSTGGIADVMTAVGSFADALGKFNDPEKMYIVTGYDANGKPIFKKTASGTPYTINMKSLANKIANSFSDFVNTLANKLGDSEFASQCQMAQTAVEAISPVIDSVSKFAEIISKANNTEGGFDAVTGASTYATALNTFINSIGTTQEIALWGNETFTEWIENIADNIIELCNGGSHMFKMLDKDWPAMTEKAAAFGNTVSTVLSLELSSAEQGYSVTIDAVIKDTVRLADGLDNGNRRARQWVEVFKGIMDEHNGALDNARTTAKTFEDEFMSRIDRVVSKMDDKIPKITSHIQSINKELGVLNDNLDRIHDGLNKIDKDPTENIEGLVNKFVEVANAQAQLIAETLSKIQPQQPAETPAQPAQPAAPAQQPAQNGEHQPQVAVAIPANPGMQQFVFNFTNIDKKEWRGMLSTNEI